MKWHWHTYRDACEDGEKEKDEVEGKGGEEKECTPR